MCRKKSDKGKWFATDNGECIKCEMDNLTDFLNKLFKGDWERAKKTAKKFHEVSKKEYEENELWSNEICIG